MQIFSIIQQGCPAHQAPPAAGTESRIHSPFTHFCPKGGPASCRRFSAKTRMASSSARAPCFARQTRFRWTVSTDACRHPARLPPPCFLQALLLYKTAVPSRSTHSSSLGLILTLSRPSASARRMANKRWATIVSGVPQSNSPVFGAFFFAFYHFGGQQGLACKGIPQHVAGAFVLAHLFGYDVARTFQGHRPHLYIAFHEGGGAVRDEALAGASAGWQAVRVLSGGRLPARVFRWACRAGRCLRGRCCPTCRQCAFCSSGVIFPCSRMVATMVSFRFAVSSVFRNGYGWILSALRPVRPSFPCGSG